MSRRRSPGAAVSSVKPPASLPAWPEQDVFAPTLTIPPDCLCSWTVVRAAPGLLCISKLKTASRACGHRHEPAEAVR